MTLHLSAESDPPPATPAPRSANPAEELERARADWEGLFGWGARRHPVDDGTRSGWDVSGRRLLNAQMRLVVGVRAVDRAHV